MEFQERGISDVVVGFKPNQDEGRERNLLFINEFIQAEFFRQKNEKATGSKCKKKIRVKNNESFGVSMQV